VEATVASLDALFEPVEARALSKSKPLVRALRTHYRSTATHLIEYSAARHALDQVDVLDFTGAEDGAERSRRRAVMLALVDATERHRRFHAGSLEALRASLAAVEGPDALINGVLTSAAREHENIASLLPQLEARAVQAKHLLRMYDLLDERTGGWTVDAEGRVVFVRDDDVRRFQSMGEAIDRAGEQLVSLEAARHASRR
jgi:hypothetical protein